MCHCLLGQSVVNRAIDEASSVGLCWRRKRTFWTLSKWQNCKFDNWRWLSVLFCCERKWTKNNSVFNWKVFFINLRSKVCTQLCDVVNFTTVTCRISSRLKWYKNYKNRSRLTKVIVKNKMSRFLWFTVYRQKKSPINFWSRLHSRSCWIRLGGGLHSLSARFFWFLSRSC